MDPTRIDAHNGPWPLHDAVASRTIEQAALAVNPPHALMTRAGLAVARLALALAPHARQFQVFAGPGNNGGDGLVAAAALHRAGRQVQVLLVDATRQPADAAHALAQAQAAGVPISTTIDAAPPAPDLVIDALLGLGARRPAESAIAAAIQRINTSAARVLAVDIPSGLHADTGVRIGKLAVRAHDTLSLLTLKPGNYTGVGRDAAGQVWLDRLGCAADAPPTAWLGGPPTQVARLHSSHKGSFGDVTVVGGAPGMAGAAWLAARAALTAGAGRVYCSLLDTDAALLDPTRPELMNRRNAWHATPAQLAAGTTLCGCGAGDAVRVALPPLLSHVQRLVLDADALNVIAADTQLQTLLQRRAAAGRHTLLTPHPLEAARLLGCSTNELQQDRLAAAQRLSAQTGCTVLLKGSGSIIAGPDRLPMINPSGNAALATAGTGDVLAGWAAGLWAQDDSADAFDIACRAAWQHGHAADAWLAAGGNGPLRAADLVEALAAR